MIADDTLSGPSCFWPWQESPYKLWSLLDMLRFAADSFVAAVTQLGYARAALLGIGLHVKQLDGPIPRMVADTVKEHLVPALAEFAKLPLPPSLHLQLRDLTSLLDGGLTYSQAVDRLNMIGRSLSEELSTLVFFYVRPQAMHLFENPQDFFGQAVFEAFPDAADDLKASGRCFGLDEWTACVFHLMRAIGQALGIWVQKIGVSLSVPVAEADWQELLNGGKKRLNELEQLPRTQRGATWQDDVSYIAETLTYFQGFKDAWRNFVSHRLVTYDERQAGDVLEAVRSFLRKQATQQRI